MRILYVDAFNGAAGDMILGACLDAGLPLEALTTALGTLGISDYTVAADRVLRAGVSATKFRLIEHAAGAHERPVTAGAGHHHDGDQPRAHTHDHTHPHHHDHGHSHTHPHEHEHRHGEGHTHTHDHEEPHGHHHHPHRSLPEILSLVSQSALSDAGKRRVAELFQRLAEAEAGIHQMPVERVHLHEVGALDSIIDIVGAVFAFEWFKADRVVVSPLNVGGGMVKSAHGIFPVPAPATLALLGDAPVYSRGPRAELLTPTGALLLTSYASAFGPLPQMRVEAVGYGAGDHDFDDTPNVLRLIVGESAERAALERILVLECEIDDMNPQIFGVLMDRLFAAGALDVFYQPVQMKKNRPGTLVTVLAPVAAREAVTSVLFRESTTIGVRVHEVERERLDREMLAVDTPLGPIRFKIARRDGAILNAAPEFDDCARIATERQLPVKDVQAAAMQAWISSKQ